LPLSVRSTRFGEIEVREEDLLEFPEGLPGFPFHRRFFLVGEEGQPIRWLHSAEDGSLALPVADPFLILPTYEAEVCDEDLSPIGPFSPEDLVLLCVLVIPSGDPLSMTANLKAPIVINVKTRKGKQVLVSGDYPIRHPVFGPEARRALAERTRGGS